MILVTGATGNLSFVVARQLAQAGVPFRGLVQAPRRERPSSSWEARSR